MTTEASWEAQMQAEDLQDAIQRTGPRQRRMLPQDYTGALWSPERIAEAIAHHVADLLPPTPPEPRRWLNKAEAIEYSRIPRGTFEKYAADGRIPSHGGKTKTFDRVELDEALRRL